MSVTVAVLALLSCACTAPVARNDLFAAASGFTRQVVSGSDFSHLVYIAENRAGTSAEKNVLHVYIEGDGMPWIRQHVIATDPTPSEPLMLQLMAQDTHPAIYLGRPCYHGMVSDSACNPWLWTYGRYSKQVVESMREALATLIGVNDITSLVLIGHSGGGTLAMLLAEQVPQTQVIVTLGGNLAIDVWADHHGYTRLIDSLNPAQRPPLPVHISQLHFVGRYDKNVRQNMLEVVVGKQSNAKLFMLDDVSHQHGWKEHWTEILQKINFVVNSYE